MNIWARANMYVYSYTCCVGLCIYIYAYVLTYLYEGMEV